MRSSRSLVLALAAGLVVMTPAGALAAPAPVAAVAGPGLPASPSTPGVTAGISPLAVLASAPSAVRAPLAPGDDGITEVDLLTPAPVEVELPSEPTPQPADPVVAQAPQRSTTAAQSVEPTEEQVDGSAGANDVIERALPTDGAAVVGLAWEPAGDARPQAQIRFGQRGTWDLWTDVEMETTAEDEGEALAPEMSEGMVAAGADTVQVRLLGVDEAPLRSARVVLVDGGAEPGDAAVTTRAALPPALMSAASDGSPVTAPMADPMPAAPTRGVTYDVASSSAIAVPRVVGRAAWGASERIPRAGCEQPEYGTRLERFVVHHTAGSNSYTAADVPAILRGIQNFHVNGRGWCDTGYNVLVDKFGTIWEGRRGGITRLVVGVHASGFNTNTVGLSVLGDFTKAAPTTASVNALAHVIGWKSYLHGLDPTGSSVKSGTSYRHVIGHREVAATACPGAFQARLGDIASGARTVMLGYQPSFSNVQARPGTFGSTPAVISGTMPAAGTWTVALLDSAGRTARTQSGTVVGPVAFAASFPRAGESPLPLGAYTARITGRTTAGKTFGATVGVTVGGAPITPYTHMVAGPDFTNNGMSDLFTIDTRGRLFLHEGFGGGRLGPPRAYGTGWSALKVYSPGDWNGDGQADLIAVDTAGRLWLYPGNGMGGFRAGARIGRGWSSFRIIPAGDLNGDGTVDLLAIDAAGGLFVYPGDGRGGWLPRVQVGQKWGSFDLHAAGDMNRDGHPDILGIDSTGRLFFYPGRPGATFGPWLQVGHGWRGYGFASGGDFNGDGINDLMGRDPQGRLWFYAGLTGGTFARKVQIDSGW